MRSKQALLAEFAFKPGGLLLGYYPTWTTANRPPGRADARGRSPWALAIYSFKLAEYSFFDTAGRRRPDSTDGDTKDLLKNLFDLPGVRQAELACIGPAARRRSGPSSPLASAHRLDWGPRSSGTAPRVKRSR